MSMRGPLTSVDHISLDEAIRTRSLILDYKDLSPLLLVLINSFNIESNT